MNIFDHTVSLLEKSIDYSAKKNDVIVNNIANVDTPNYRAKNVEFQNVLNNEMKNLQARRSHEKHLPFSTEINNNNILTQNKFVYRHDGNNVDIDKEMAQFAKNQIYYQSVVDRLNGKFGILQNVIRGGK